MKPLNRPVIERRGGSAPRQPFKPKAWNHQDELKENKGKAIVITHRDGQTATGILMEADQFTLKVLADFHDGKSAVTYFKHDLAGYAFLKEA